MSSTLRAKRGGMLGEAVKTFPRVRRTAEVWGFGGKAPISLLLKFGGIPCLLPPFGGLGGNA
jgi:hypothetical protein